MNKCVNCDREIYNPQPYGGDNVGAKYYFGLLHKDTDENRCGHGRRIAWPYADISAAFIPEP